jgi:hypothetical protein
MQNPNRTLLFVIRKMDCPSEEYLIRVKLANLKNISSMNFDIPKRSLAVYHSGDYAPILNEINSLHLDASVIETGTADKIFAASKDVTERKILWQVLAINFFFFALEILTGLISSSMGLVADSLDMLADSLVYGLALFAVGGTTARNKHSEIEWLFPIDPGSFGYHRSNQAFSWFWRRSHLSNDDFNFIACIDWKHNELVPSSKKQKHRSPHASKHDFCVK